jgi:hypothetical protein
MKIPVVRLVYQKFISISQENSTTVFTVIYNARTKVFRRHGPAVYGVWYVLLLKYLGRVSCTGCGLSADRTPGQKKNTTIIY